MPEHQPAGDHEGAIAIGHETFWLDVYRLLACFLSSKAIAAQDIPDWPRGLKTREREEISRLLIHVATYYRVKYDDGSWEHAEWLHTEEYRGAGTLVEDVSKPDKTSPLEFREACNKIIHARRVNFDVETDPITKVEFFNPVVYLYGTKSKCDWKATIQIIAFCKAASNVIV